MSSTKGSSQFRKHLPDLSTPRFQALKNNDAYGHVEDFLQNQNPPWLYGLYQHWRELFKVPFKGVTSDGEYMIRHLIGCFGCLSNSLAC